MSEQRTRIPQNVPPYVVLDIETTGSDPRLGHELVAVGAGGKVYEPTMGRFQARRLMMKAGVTLVAHTNFDLRWLMLDGAVLADGVHYHDTKVMAWMLDAHQALDLDSLAQRYLGYSPPKPIKMVKGRVMFRCSLGLVPIEDVPWDEMEAYNQSDIDTEALLYEALRDDLVHAGLWDHFVTEEAPMSRLLIEMEAAGMPFDAERAEAMLEETNADLERIHAWLVRCTRAPGFNPGSGDQVAAFLYEEVWEHKVQFPIPRLNGMSKADKLTAVEGMVPSNVKVTKVGRDYGYGHMILDGRGLVPPKPKKDAPYGARPTVNSKVLAVLHGGDPWVVEYLEWRRLDKLRGYLVDWLERVHEGRLHTRFDQSGTVSGRLTSRQPNLQQVSSQAGVRDLFRGALIVGDYAGLEVRLSAHFSQDPLMMQVFNDGLDLYGTLAAEAWGGPATKENPRRGLMKVLMLGSQYGARGETLSGILALAGMRGYTAHKATGLLHDLENTMPRLFAWREEVIRDAKGHGYVTTIGNRKRHLSGLNSAVWKVMARAERQAVNSLVQGSAADVVRRAMLKAREAVDPEVARIILQVHDEILWERRDEWQSEWFDTLVDYCEHGTGFELTVPLIFEAKVADSWAAKGGNPGQVSAGAYAMMAEAE